MSFKHFDFTRYLRQVMWIAKEWHQIITGANLFNLLKNFATIGISENEYAMKMKTTPISFFNLSKCIFYFTHQVSLRQIYSLSLNPYPSGQAKHKPCVLWAQSEAQSQTYLYCKGQRFHLHNQRQSVYPHQTRTNMWLQLFKEKRKVLGNSYLTTQGVIC